MKGKNITIFGLGANGWLDLKDAKVIDSMDGYKISLPKVLILN